MLTLISSQNPLLFRFFWILIGSVLLTNCGTIYTLVEHEPEDALIFSGIRFDVDVIVDPPGYPVPIPLEFYFLCIFDTPFSLVADVVVLPYTLPRDIFARAPERPRGFSSETYADFSGADINNTLDFSGITELKELNLSNTSLEDGDLARIRREIEEKTVLQWTSLRKLDLSYTSISDEGLYALKSLNQLENLNLSGTAIQGDGLTYIQGFSSLNEINLNESHVTNEGLRSLQNLPALERIYLNNTSLQGDILLHFVQFPKLQQIAIHGITVAPQILKTFKQKRPQCEVYGSENE